MPIDPALDPHIGGQSQPRSVDALIAQLAGRQHGVVARRQLVELGVGRRAIGNRVERGRLHVVHRGVYAVGHRALTQRGRWMAAVLAAGPGARAEPPLRGRAVGHPPDVPHTHRGHRPKDPARDPAPSPSLRRSPTGRAHHAPRDPSHHPRPNPPRPRRHPRPPPARASLQRGRSPPSHEPDAHRGTRAAAPTPGHHQPPNPPPQCPQFNPKRARGQFLAFIDAPRPPDTPDEHPHRGNRGRRRVARARTHRRARRLRPPRNPSRVRSGPAERPKADRGRMDRAASDMARPQRAPTRDRRPDPRPPLNAAVLGPTPRGARANPGPARAAPTRPPRSAAG